jgi:hypothetical protein
MRAAGMPSIVLVLKESANKRLRAARSFGDGTEKHVRCCLGQKRQYVFD